MKRKACYSFISTILNLICDIGLFIASLVMALMGLAALRLLEQSGNIIDGAGSDELTGGYQVLGGFGLGLIGGMALAMIIAILIGLVIATFVLLITVIVGFVSRYRYKTNKPVSFKLDSILKIVIDGILTVAGIAIFYQTWYECLLVVVIPLVVIALSIINLCTMASSH